MEPTIDTVVYLAERCRCRQGAVCFHRQPLLVIRRFETSGRLLVSNGSFVRAVDSEQVSLKPTKRGGMCALTSGESNPLRAGKSP
jgi:hypothetical protein